MAEQDRIEEELLGDGADLLNEAERLLNQNTQPNSAMNSDSSTENASAQPPTSSTSSENVTGDGSSINPIAGILPQQGYFTAEQVQAMIMSLQENLIKNMQTRNQDSLPGTSRQVNKIPELVPREFKEDEILTHKSVFSQWSDKVLLQLEKAQHLPMINEKMGGDLLDDQTEKKKNAMDAAVRSFIFNTVDSNIWDFIKTNDNSFDMWNALKKLFDFSKNRTIDQINRKWTKLHFRVGYSPLLYVTRFQGLIREYEAMNCNFSPEYLATNFLTKLMGQNEIENPIYSFVKNMNSLPVEERSLQNYITAFLATDFGNYELDDEYPIEQYMFPQMSRVKVVKMIEESFDEDSSEDSSSDSESYESSEVFAPRGFNRKKRDRQDWMFFTGIPATYQLIENVLKRKREEKAKEKTSKPKSDDAKGKSSSHAVKSLTDKYTTAQIDQLAKMSLEEKKKIRCRKCDDYFHDETQCPNTGKRCFNCNLYGHISKECKAPKRQLNKHPDNQ